MSDLAISVRGLVKSYGDVRAVDGVSFTVARGTVLGLLGPNGAGKTTVVRALTTLLRPDEGEIVVDGVDAISDAPRLRERIGLAGQNASVDESLTGSENLVMFGRLYGMSRKEAKARAATLLEQFSLTDAAKRPVKGYSGGMRRRLDLAASLVAEPPVLFLDEPTTGLDPRSRIELWEVIERLVVSGTTVLLTTQYLDEADRLADQIAVIDHGRVIAEGTSDELKERLGGERLVLVLDDAADAQRAVDALAPLAVDTPTAHEGEVTLRVADRAGAIVRAVELLGAAEIPVYDIGLHRPSLDDVFLTLTGRSTEAEETPA